jgi:hypothetical protein
MSGRLGGRPTTSRGHTVGAFPQLRLVALIETGTHALCDVVIRPFRCAEQPAGLRLLRSVGPGMLLRWDRAFHSYAMVHQTLAHGAHFLGRTKSNVVLDPVELLADGSFLAQVYPTPTARRHRVDGLEVRVIEYMLDTTDAPGQAVYRLITSLLDAQAFPAQVLASTYHERWEIEIILSQLTKPRVEAALAGRDHIPDLHIIVGDDHAIDQQFDQLPTPGEGCAVQILAQTRAQVSH